MSIASLMQRKVHNALFEVKSKRTVDPCFLHGMDFDDRPEPAKRLEIARKRRGFKTARDAAIFFGWSPDTYVQHENGTRGLARSADRYSAAYGVSEGWLLTGEGGETTRVPLMGYVGAGAEVEPDFEQVPEDGMEEIEVPFPLPADMIAFQVKGDSMLPMFEDGMIIIVFREQRKGIDNFFGQRVIVRTVEGKRFVKTLMRGSAEGRVSLLSWNANPIENVEIVWIGEIFTYFPGSSVKHVANKVRRQGGIQGQLRRA